MKDSGFIIRLLDGREGRTYHSNGLVDNKVPVFLKIGDKYSGNAIFCSLASIMIIGCID